MYDLTVIILGAAVLENGEPSGAMRRRVKAALDLRNNFKKIRYIPSGGVGKDELYSEAGVMKNLLQEAGVKENDIILDESSRNTFESIINCATIIHSLPRNEVTICSDTYHILRSRLLLRFLGIPTIYKSMPSGLKVNGITRWSYYYVREFLAIPKDLFLLILRNVLNDKSSS
jgi:vancomycin permeability regulator SanA